MTLLDEELRTFLQSDMAVLVGTRDANLMGEVAAGWGPRALDNDELELFVDRLPGEKTLANLRDNRLIAVTCTSPITYQSVQLKGWCLGISEPTAEDEAWVARHRELFAASCRARGMPAHASRTLWTRDIVKLRMLAQDRFNQTPGPNAGAKV